jgi:hypothetical protein
MHSLICYFPNSIQYSYQQGHDLTSLHAYLSWD